MHELVHKSSSFSLGYDRPKTNFKKETFFIPLFSRPDDVDCHISLLTSPYVTRRHFFFFSNLITILKKEKSNMKIVGIFFLLPKIDGVAVTIVAWFSCIL